MTTNQKVISSHYECFVIFIIIISLVCPVFMRKILDSSRRQHYNVFSPVRNQVNVRISYFKITQYQLGIFLVKLKQFWRHSAKTPFSHGETQVKPNFDVEAHLRIELLRSDRPTLVLLDNVEQKVILGGKTKTEIERWRIGRSFSIFIGQKAPQSI